MVPEAKPLEKATWVIDTAHTSVEFATKHMVISTVRGRFSKFDATVEFDAEHPERSIVQAKIDATSIDTREPDRDKHLRSADFFNVEKFPYLTFKSKRIEKKGTDKFKVVGDLTIKDVTREVEMDVIYSGLAKDPWGNTHAGFSAEGAINRKDFGLTWNMALETGGLLVGDHVKMNIEAELVKKAQS